jgi:hypothetical protein
VAKVRNKMAGRMRKKPGALVMKNSEQTGEEEPFVTSPQNTGEEIDFSEGSAMKKFFDPRRRFGTPGGCSRHLLRLLTILDSALNCR